MQRNVILLFLALTALFALPLAAQNNAAAEPAACDNPSVSESKAKYIARTHLIEMGFTAPFASNKTFRIGSTVCENGRWRIKLRIGVDSSVPNQTAYVVVNCDTGAIEESI